MVNAQKGAYKCVDLGNCYIQRSPVYWLSPQLYCPRELKLKRQKPPESLRKVSQAFLRHDYPSP